jgi:hypothetical protein
MGDVTSHPPVLLIMAAFSRHDAALDWAQQRAEAQWGPLALASDRFEFTETGYYERSMGSDLRKTFFAFEQLVDPAELASVKLQTNAWEREYAEAAGHAEERPLNLDPGYLSQAKLVLATTKDRDHRIYIGQGMFAEVTITYRRDSGWVGREWTYPDYLRDDYHEFFDRCRAYLRQHRPKNTS